MANNKETVFSDFEARQLNIIFAPADLYAVKCVGKVESEAGILVITKKCRGKVAKKRTRSTGEGTLKVTAHMPYECYLRLHDMERDDLAEGVHAYGQQSLHPEVAITCDIFDEDDVEKFRAYPRCVISTGANSTIENGGEEVAEVELEIGFMPDDFNEGFYEALASELSEELKGKWMNEFTPELVHKTGTSAPEPSENGDDQTVTA